jgi:hypothetical protein
MRTVAGVSVDGTTLTVDRAWNRTPDATSVFIVEDASWFPNAQSSAFGVSALGGSGYSTIATDIGNIQGQTVLFQVLIGDSTGTYFSSANRSPFRLWYVFGNPGNPNPPIGPYLVPIVNGVATPDASKGTNLLILTADTSVAQCINYATGSGLYTNWDLIIQQDPVGMTGGHSTIFDPSYYFTFVLASSASPANTQCHAFFRTNNTGQTSIAGAPSSDQPIPS